jgi:hypothetical protein
MSELSEIKQLLETHRKESNDWRTEMSDSIARIETHNEYTKEKLKDVDDLKTKVNADRNKVLGAIWVFATGFITMVIAFVISLFYNDQA